MTKELVKKPVDRLKAIINQPTVQEQFKNAMGRHSDLFIASLIDVFNSGLQDCDPAGVIQESLKAAVLKLPISKSLGFAYLVPYNQKYKEGNQWKTKKVPQFQIGYKGMIQLAMRSGQVKNINAGPIFEGEEIEVDRLRGTVVISGKAKNDNAIGYFAYMELINGFEKTVCWTKKQVVAHAKDKSASYGNKKSAWFTDFDAMATKTLLRALFSKYAPMSIDFVTSIGMDDDEKQAKETKNITLEVEEIPPNKDAAKTPKKTPARQPASPDSDQEFFESIGDKPEFGEENG